MGWKQAGGKNFLGDNGLQAKSFTPDYLSKLSQQEHLKGVPFVVVNLGYNDIVSNPNEKPEKVIANLASISQSIVNQNKKPILCTIRSRSDDNDVQKDKIKKVNE